MSVKILYFALNKYDTTAWWRCLPLDYISNPEFTITDISSLKEITTDTIKECKVFIFQRPFAKEHADMIAAIKSKGCKVILDYDDDLFNVDMYNPTYSLYGENRQYFKACVQQADELWVSTDAIKESYQGFCGNIQVIPNAHNDRLFPVKNKRPHTDNKRCFMRGGSSHQADVYECAEDLMLTINAHLDWEFTFCGDRYTFLEQRCGDNYHIFPGAPIMDWFKHFNEQNPQVLIFPLRNTPFNHAKSNIAWIEGTYAGAAVFGNKTLPQFAHTCIGDVSEFSGYMFGYNKWGYIGEDLKRMNTQSWELICDTLLLSNINKLREERILAAAT